MIYFYAYVDEKKILISKKVFINLQSSVKGKILYSSKSKCGSIGSVQFDTKDKTVGKTVIFWYQDLAGQDVLAIRTFEYQSLQTSDLKELKRRNL